MKITKEEAFKMLQGKKVYAGEFTEEVQEKLFEIGFTWACSGNKIMGYKFIIIFPYELQTCSNYKNFIEYFDNEEEITISQILGIELEDEFKDGDILHSDWGGENINFILKNSLTGGGFYFYYASMSNTLGLIFDNSCWDKNTNPRLATDKEKQTLFNELYKQGYKWNAEEKKLEKKRWRAELNGKYYFIDQMLNVYEDNDGSLSIDIKRYNANNYFKTEQEAQQYADKIKELLLNR